MGFSRFAFDPRIAQGIASVGFVQPTPIQQAAIPEVLSGRDVLGVAQTGTGKTAAFMLPILQRLLDGPRGRVRALVLAPTRELAEQILQATRVYGKATSLRAVSVYGGVGRQPQIDKLRKGAEIVIACPGRLLDLHADGAVDLSRLDTLVLDEADRMCDMGFLPDIRRILALVPERRQTLFFSATMPPEIRGLSRSILTDPSLVQIGAPKPAATVAQAFYPVTEPLKNALLEEILLRNGRERTLVFTRTKHRARRLARALGRTGHRVAELQGDMAQSKRQAAIDGFRKGRYDILVATDIAARGIDVIDIGLVVNYDMPDTVDAYTHRVGRTGRAERTGEAVTLASTADRLLVLEIQQQLGEPVEQRVLPGFDYGAFTPRLRTEVDRTPPVPSHARGGGGRRGASRRRPPRFS